MRKMNSLKPRTSGRSKMVAEADTKEKECVKATGLSENLNEAVEKHLVKSSSDEARAKPR